MACLVLVCMCWCPINMTDIRNICRKRNVHLGYFLDITESRHCQVRHTFNITATVYVYYILCWVDLSRIMPVNVGPCQMDVSRWTGPRWTGPRWTGPRWTRPNETPSKWTPSIWTRPSEHVHLNTSIWTTIIKYGAICQVRLRH